MNIEINQSCDLVIFGAKGDLSQRKLLPALYKLEKLNKITKNTRIIGAGRADWSVQEYIKTVKTSIKFFLNEEINNVIWKKFSNRLHFCNIDVNEITQFVQLKTILEENKHINIYYCAMPPDTLTSIFIGLKHANLILKSSRIILEKPLGICLKTSKKIHDNISKYFSESQIFRIDHYLGKESILNLIALRFANSLFFNNWDNTTIDHVQITISEEVGIEGRWNYFDNTGQMKDMVQNHILQILTILAMNQPQSITSEHIKREKLKVLRCLKPINKNNITKYTVRGQYSDGLINGKHVPSYLEEKGANKNSNTETFVAIKVYIDNKKWLGVPFYIRTGKRLPYKYSEIVVFFKKMPINLFQHSQLQDFQNKLIIRLEPNANIKIDFLNKTIGLDREYKLEQAQLQSHYSSNKYCKNIVDAYERLLLESMRGIQSLFVSREEIEASWQWIDPIVAAWKNKKNYRPTIYKSGTWGPENSNLLLLRDGHFWYEYN